MSEDLNQLRSAIDNLDNEILQVLAKRMKLSDQVIAAKNGAVAFRPGREAALVRKLVINNESNGHDLSPSVILGVWRQIMAASLSRQNGDLAFAVHDMVMPAAAWHMGSALAATSFDQMTPLLDAVASAQCRYGLVPANHDIAALLTALDQHQHLSIIARTPLYDMPALHPAYIIADYLPDPSGDDISLYAVPTADGFALTMIDGHHGNNAVVDAPANLPRDARLVGIYAR
ncbi:MAG: chorismate mutase [Candidatus Puniceispirillum sp.]|nr:chorismate mutase [Candidatus Puniceispirillum sp.]